MSLRIRRASLALTSILATLLVAELLLALLAPQIYRLPQVWTFDETLGWRHRPGATGRLRTPEFDVTYYIDSLGRRVGDPARLSRSESKTTQIISLYGDSFAEGWGVEAEESLAGQLEEILRQQASTIVHNYGTAGYGTDQELLLYSTSGRDQASDIVILLFYGNDLWNNASAQAIGAERGDKPYFTVGPDQLLRLKGVPARRHPHWDRVERRSMATTLHLAALLATLQRPDEVPSAQRRGYYAGLYGLNAPEYDEHWDLTCRLLQRFHRSVIADGRKFVVVYAPSALQIDPDRWAKVRSSFHELDGTDESGDFDLMKPNRQLATWAVDAGVPMLDLTTAFRFAHEKGEELFYQDSHWRRSGHRLAAEQTAAFLERMGWLR